MIRTTGSGRFTIVLDKESHSHAIIIFYLSTEHYSHAILIFYLSTEARHSAGGYIQR